jgi:RNA polymerase sigma factor (sigma-70 family)
MAHAQTTPVGRFLHRLTVAHLAAAAPDDELVERFAVHQEQAAFAALVRRHGPLVLGVCRRVLAEAHAAEDCFQATFLVFARKAGSLRRPGALGPWLYGVATRTALRVRARAARQRVCERRAAVAEAVAPSDGLVWQDLRPKLDEAVAGLAEKYRAPFVLHHLEGLTVAEVAQRLGCPQGTTAARLARAKTQLRARLTRQGLAPCAGVLAALLARGAASAAVPPTLAQGTVRAAMFIAAGNAAGPLSATAAALTMGGIPVMSVSKLKIALGVLVAVSALGIGVGVFPHVGPGGGHAGPWRGATPAVLDADGGQPHRGDSPALGRYYAGGFHTLRGFGFRGVSPQGSSPGSGCEDPQAPASGCGSLQTHMEEQRTGSLLFGAGVNSDAGLVGSIVLNERNFDLLRPPQKNPEHQSPTRENDPPPVVGLLDNGTVERDAGPNYYRVSAGAGLRVTVPTLGPVPVWLDFGFPIATEAEQTFGFWLGIFS